MSNDLYEAIRSINVTRFKGEYKLNVERYYSIPAQIPFAEYRIDQGFANLREAAQKVLGVEVGAIDELSELLPKAGVELWVFGEVPGSFSSVYREADDELIGSIVSGFDILRARLDWGIEEDFIFSE